MKVLVTAMVTDMKKSNIFSYWGMFVLWKPFCLTHFLYFSRVLLVFLYFQIAFLAKVFFLSLTKACPVFLASFSGYNIWPTIIFLNFLKSLSCVTIFSAIYPAIKPLFIFLLSNNFCRWNFVYLLQKFLALLHFRTPLYYYWWFIMKKQGWKLCRSPKPNPRGYESAIAPNFWGDLD